MKRFGKEGKLMQHSAKGCPNGHDSGRPGRAGLRTLRQGGIGKVWAGLTTIRDVRAGSSS